MCGIFGTTIKNATAGQAFSALAHRGPDDKGEWKNENVLLSQTRLSIIDLSSGGHQPMINESGDLTLVFNGEIYNYKELKGELEREGARFRSKSDTEVILKGFEKYGEEYFHKLRGMYTIAIYDTKKNVLTLARDQFGIKPLFYSNINQKIIFGSEVKALAPYLSKLTPNTENYFLFYNFGYFPGGETSFKEIKKVSPGEIISFNLTDHTSRQRFITLPSSQGEINNKINNTEEAASLIQKALRDSINKHFIADVPVSLLLSGGNDSSFIAALAKEAGQNPTCFNISMEGSLDNDYAEKVANYLKLPYEKIEVKKSEFKDEYNKILERLDQPTSDVSFIPTSIVYKMIKGKSKVALSGEGGDELFGGYLRHNTFSDLNQMGFNSFFLDLSSVSKKSLGFLNPLFNKLRDSLLSFESLGSRYLYKGRQMDIAIKQKETLEFLKQYYNNHSYKDSIQPNLFFDMFMYLPGSLMYKGDACSMAYSIEGRTPFLDKDLFEAVSKVSPKLRLSKEFQSKKIMKIAMEKYLPKELIYRNKTGFGININKYKELVLLDLIEALKFHQLHKEELGVTDSGLENILIKENAELILKKYPRFAFSLITNYKVMSKYCF
jgi:asparagine synthase (glutamine-hydrolysing)